MFWLYDLTVFWPQDFQLEIFPTCKLVYGTSPGNVELYLSNVLYTAFIKHCIVLEMPYHQQLFFHQVIISSETWILLLNMINLWELVCHQISLLLFNCSISYWVEFSGIPIKTTPPAKPKWSGPEKNKKRSRVHKKVLNNLNSVGDGVEVIASSTSQDEADAEDTPCKIRKRRKLLRKTRVKRQKGISHVLLHILANILTRRMFCCNKCKWIFRCSETCVKTCSIRSAKRCRCR